MASSPAYGSRQAMIIAMGKILAMVATFIVPLFLTRFLSKSDYGIYSQFYTITLFLAQIFIMGIPVGLYYFFPTATPSKQNLLVKNTYFALLILAVLSVALLNIPQFGALLLGDSELMNYIWIISICMFLFIPTKIVEPLYILRNDSITALIYPLCEVTLKAFFVVVMALLGKDLKSIFIGVAITHFLLFIFGLIYSFKGRGTEKKIIDIALLKSQISYGVPFGLAVMFNTLAQQFDKIVAIGFLSTNQYATYSIAFFGIPGIMQIYDSLCQVNVISMTESYQRGQIQEVLTKYKSFVIKTLSFSLPIITVVFLYARKIITLLFTDKYSDSTLFFRIYILTFIIGMLGAGTILRATGKTKLSFKAYLISSIFTLPATYLLIRNYGSIGAISGAVLSTMLPRIFQIRYEVKLLGCSFKDYFPWKPFRQIFIISLALIVPLVASEIFFSLNIWISGQLAVFYLIAAYLLMISQNVFIVNKEALYSIKDKIKRTV